MLATEAGEAARDVHEHGQGNTQPDDDKPQRFAGCREGLLGGADSDELPHQQAQVVAHRAAEVALAPFLAAAQRRSALPAVIEQVAKAAFEMFASRSQERFAAFAAHGAAGSAQGAAMLLAGS